MPIKTIKAPKKGPVARNPTSKVIHSMARPKIISSQAKIAKNFLIIASIRFINAQT
jgi:hypothetical protein